jgi:hypothetical protein
MLAAIQCESTLNVFKRLVGRLQNGISAVTSGELPSQSKASGTGRGSLLTEITVFNSGRVCHLVL